MKKNLRSSYKLYHQNNKDGVDCKTYLQIVSSYNQFLSQKVLEGHEITLPARMGTLAIVGRKQKVRLDENGEIQGLAPDWVKTKQLWESNPEAKAQRKRLFHTNVHTDNTRYKFLWSKAKVLVKNKTLYALRMTRSNKRAVHSLIKEGVQFKTV